MHGANTTGILPQPFQSSERTIQDTTETGCKQAFICRAVNRTSQKCGFVSKDP